MFEEADAAETTVSAELVAQSKRAVSVDEWNARRRVRVAEVAEALHMRGETRRAAHAEAKRKTRSRLGCGSTK